MTVDQVLAELKALGNEKVREYNVRSGAGENQFGVKMGDIRALAKKIKVDHELAKELWQSGNLEARLLATLILKPSQLSGQELDAMVRSVHCSPEASLSQLADWLMSYVVKQHPSREELRISWMTDPHPMAARAGWSLTADRVVKAPEGLDLSALIDRIEREMTSVTEPPRWAMNYCLGEIGIHHPEHRERVLALGEALGVYRDWPVSKGCVAPYVPTWVAELVRRQG